MGHIHETAFPIALWFFNHGGGGPRAPPSSAAAPARPSGRAPAVTRPLVFERAARPGSGTDSNSGRPRAQFSTIRIEGIMVPPDPAGPKLSPVTVTRPRPPNNIAQGAAGPAPWTRSTDGPGAPTPPRSRFFPPWFSSLSAPAPGELYVVCQRPRGSRRRQSGLQFERPLTLPSAKPIVEVGGTMEISLEVRDPAGGGAGSLGRAAASKCRRFRRRRPDRRTSAILRGHMGAAR